MTREDVCRVLKCGEVKISQLIRDGQLGYVRVGKSKRFTAEQVRAFIADSTVRTQGH
ncbi:MAG: helix-turn-helix domain-containing protein [Porticoccaceae bacterium]